MKGKGWQSISCGSLILLCPSLVLSSLGQIPNGLQHTAVQPPPHMAVVSQRKAGSPLSFYLSFILFIRINTDQVVKREFRSTGQTS